MNLHLTRIFRHLLLLLAFLAAIQLGFWQLHRATALKESAKPVIEKPVVAFLELAKPRQTISAAALNRLVTVTGVYDRSYSAPDQVAVNGKRGTWQIGVLRIKNASAVLVVRGLGDPKLPTGEVTVSGRYKASQFQDVVPYSANPHVLTRIDSALLLSSSPYDYYDGYIIASSESPPPVQVPVRVPIEMPKPHVPGFYWQHLAYTLLWWFFAGMVLMVWFGIDVRRKP